MVSISFELAVEVNLVASKPLQGLQGEQIPRIFPVSMRRVAESFRVETSRAVWTVPAKVP
jgi:hypothetical protein